MAKPWPPMMPTRAAECCGYLGCRRSSLNRYIACRSFVADEHIGCRRIGSRILRRTGTCACENGAYLWA